MIGELIWIVIIVAIVAWVAKGVSDFNKAVNMGVAKLTNGKDDDRWIPASELLNEMDKEQQKLRYENKQEESDEGDDDVIMAGL